MKCEKCQKEYDLNQDYDYKPLTLSDYEKIQKVDGFICDKCKTTNVFISETYNNEDFSDPEPLNPKFPYFEQLNIPDDFSYEYDTANELKYVEPRACVIYCRYILQKVIHQTFKESYDTIDNEIDEILIVNKPELANIESLLKSFKQLANSATHAELKIKNYENIENNIPSIADIDINDADCAIQTMEIFLNMFFNKKKYTEEEIDALTRTIKKYNKDKGKTV